MIIEDRVQGIPCRINVTYYAAPAPAMRTGTGYGDVIAPEEEEIEYQILDRRGYPALWLARKVTPREHARLMRVIRETVQEGQS